MDNDGNPIPNDVVDNILERLPIEDLVKTSLLSKEWRYKWASIPRVEFQNSFFDKCEHLHPLEISSIVTEVLLVHAGPINKFVFHIPSNIPIKYECLNKCIVSLSRKDIKFLELYNAQEDPFDIPSNIFSCLGLTHLELDNFTTSYVPNFSSFQSLVTLHLSEVMFESNAFESLVFDCPALVMLSITNCSGFESINVFSPAFKFLYFQAVKVIKSITFARANDVTGISLLVEEPFHNLETYTISDLIKGLRKVKSICLGEGYIQMFSRGTFPGRWQRSLNYLTHLVLFGVNFNESRELLFAISLLKSTPNLEKLLIESYNSNIDVGVPYALEESEKDSCCLGKLLNVDLKVNYAFKNTLNFIRFLLANSPSLMTFTLTVSPAQGLHHTISNIIQELNQIRTQSLASTNAELRFSISNEFLD